MHPERMLISISHLIRPASQTGYESFSCLRKWGASSYFNHCTKVPKGTGQSDLWRIGGHRPPPPPKDQCGLWIGGPKNPPHPLVVQGMCLTRHAPGVVQGHSPPIPAQVPRGPACSNSRPQLGVGGGLEGGGGGRWVGRSAAGVPRGGGSVGTPTYIPQHDPHDTLIILNIHKWVKIFFSEKFAY